MSTTPIAMATGAPVSTPVPYMLPNVTREYDVCEGDYAYPVIMIGVFGGLFACIFYAALQHYKALDWHGALDEHKWKLKMALLAFHTLLRILVALWAFWLSGGGCDTFFFYVAGADKGFGAATLNLTLMARCGVTADDVAKVRAQLSRFC